MNLNEILNFVDNNRRHIKESLVGAVLWVSWSTIGKTAVIYGLVGALHIALHKRFFLFTSLGGSGHCVKSPVPIITFMNSLHVIQP